MHKLPDNRRRLIFLIIAASVFGTVCNRWSRAQSLEVVERQNGLRLSVGEGNSLPTLRITLPGVPSSASVIEVLFPEHVTVREHGKTEAVHLYRWRQGQQGNAPGWRKVGQSLEYEMDLKSGVRMTARATLETDGVRYHYTFDNGSGAAYDMIEAIWDPRMYQSIFRDVCLERTYVHRQEGFELIASDMPSRLTMPLKQWLPCRYLDAYTWPVPPPDKRVVKDEDGITYYNASRPVDQPFIAALSQERDWVAATCNPKTGNVWTNPELTCQHTDPEASLKASGTTEWERKTFLFKGTLDQALEKVKHECKWQAE